LPLSPVITAIHPVHLPKSVSEVCLVISFVDVAAGPGKNPIAPFLIVSVAPVVPVVLPVARRLAIEIISLVYVSIRKTLNSLAVFEALLELPLIGIPVEPGVNAVSLWLAKSPFSLVGVAAMSPPHARTVL